MLTVVTLSAPATMSLDLPFPARPSEAVIRWFSARGSVVRVSDRTDVFVGGTLIGSFDSDDLVTRDVLLACLAGDPFTQRGRLARAFEVSPETLRQVRLRYRSGGVAGVLGRPRRGDPRKLTPTLRRRLFRAFDAGFSVSDAHEEVGARVSRATVGAVRVEWAARRALNTTEAASPSPNSPPVAAESEPVAVVMPVLGVSLASGENDAPAPDPGDFDESAPAIPIGEADGVSLRAGNSQVPPPPAPAPQVTAVDMSVGGTPAEPVTVDPAESKDSSGANAPAGEAVGSALPSMGSTLRGSAEELRGARVRIHEHHPIGGRGVQHLGTWLMIAVVVGMGLYRCAEAARPDAIARHALRIALDALTAALCIGERVVEGVRRLATPTARLLLRSSQPPSATWVRRILGTLAAAGRGEQILLDMANEYLRVDEATADGAPLTFYIDGHLRPYTGQATIRKGWRMQDKHVVAGVTDYYVHDVDGRPLLRVDVPSHDSLTTWLSPIAEFLQEALGTEVKILIAFDRGGAFPAQMMDLRDNGFEFVTYERAPYPTLPGSVFQESFTYRGETIAFCENHLKNLGGGRGRVRRIACRTQDARQINMLAVSDQTPEALYRAIRGRWQQENGLKHQNERWGINQLDGRTIKPCNPETIIPNPGRRRLDQAIRIERAREGRALRELARLAPDDPRRVRWEEELSEAIACQDEFIALRPAFPKHAPLKETELAGKLVEHPGEYKALIDTVRLACANAESELACILAGSLSRPEEAKRVLQNLLLAPGDIQVSEQHITIRLQPAGTTRELQAIAELLAECSTWDLTLPGDPGCRPLRFQLQS